MCGAEPKYCIPDTNGAHAPWCTDNKLHEYGNPYLKLRRESMRGICHTGTLQELLLRGFDFTAGSELTINTTFT